MTTTRPTLYQIVLDAHNVRGLAEFYRQLFGLVYLPGDEPTDEGPDDADWLVLCHPDGGRALAFQRTLHLEATTWPKPGIPMQLHLDTTVPDTAALASARDLALSLGAREILDRPGDDEEPLYVFTDPAGHPFCIFVV